MEPLQAPVCDFSFPKFVVCVLALEVLGHKVLQDGRQVAEPKRNKILDWPKPWMASHILQFLGLCSFVHMFIKRFAEIASPMRRLTRKNAEWNWTQECEKVFLALKEIVGWKILLKELEFNSNGIRLAVGSSEFGAGGVLTQEEDGKD